MKEQVLELLDVLNAPMAWFMTLSPYISMTIVGLILATVLTLAGFALARMGYKPLWALVLIVPTLNIIGLWAAAYRRFPREKLKL
jgi:hypothetical protein